MYPWQPLPRSVIVILIIGNILLSVRYVPSPVCYKHIHVWTYSSQQPHYYPLIYFIDEETKAPRGYTTCRSSQFVNGETGIQPGQPGSGVCPPSPCCLFLFISSIRFHKAWQRSSCLSPLSLALACAYDAQEAFTAWGGRWGRGGTSHCQALSRAAFWPLVWILSSFI